VLSPLLVTVPDCTGKARNEESGATRGTCLSCVSRRKAVSPAQAQLGSSVVEIALPIHRRKSLPERDPTLGFLSSSALRSIFVRGAQRRLSASTTAPIHRSRAEWSVRRGETFSRSGLSTSRALQAISGPSRATLRSCTLDPSRVYSAR